MSSTVPGPVPIPVPFSDPAAELAANRLTIPNEGWSSVPYQDVGGVWTIGYGSTIDDSGNRVTASTPSITSSEGAALLMRDLLSAVAVIDRHVTVPLLLTQTAALADFVYNEGAAAFESSTLLALLNKGDYQGAVDQFRRWDLGGGFVLSDLVRRRRAEATIFVEGTTLTI